MTTLEMNVDEKRNALDGKLTQVKGVVQEQWGNMQNDEMARLAGKKDQVIGHLQANYSDSWVMRHAGILLVTTAVAFFGTLLTTILFTRHRSQSSDS